MLFLYNFYFILFLFYLFFIYFLFYFFAKLNSNWLTKPNELRWSISSILSHPPPTHPGTFTKLNIGKLEGSNLVHKSNIILINKIQS